ncbi:MAG: WHG domain-containing protein, partial [Burkholderiales bacterium]|nr:WHG domain-containing protein [Burkholderiales bacterium]
ARAYIRMGLERPNHYSLMFMTPLIEADSSLMQEKIANPENDSYRLFRSIVEDCVGAGAFKPELTDAELLAQTLWSGLHGVLSLHIAMGDHPFVDWRPVETRACFMHDLILRGMLREGVACPQLALDPAQTPPA